MATIKEYFGKKGKSYNISVSCGYDNQGKQIVKRMTWHPDPDMTEAQIRKELDKQVIKFENKYKAGHIASSIKFEEFAEQWFDEYGKTNLHDYPLRARRDRFYDPALRRGGVRYNADEHQAEQDAGF